MEARFENAPFLSMPDLKTAVPVSHGFGTIVLAAGSSSRMGTAKQLLELEGSPLIVRVVVAALASEANPVVVVLGANEESIRLSIADRPVIVARNPGWPEGISSSIRVGLAAILEARPDLEAVLVTPCDQPALSSEILRQLYAAHQATGRIACARYKGRNGSPAVFGRQHFPLLKSLSGDKGARDLLNGDRGSVEALEIPSLGIDFDTPSDYSEWNK
jgi:molybdenum cofactor cytidylyltransferase